MGEQGEAHLSENGAIEELRVLQERHLSPLASGVQPCLHQE